MKQINVDKETALEAPPPEDSPHSCCKEMLEQMFMCHVMKVLDDESFCTCQFCSEIYPLAHANLLKCEAAGSHNFVDNTQQKI